MNDLNKAFENSTPPAAGDGPSYAHPLADSVVEECSKLLSQIPEGQRLLAFAKEKGITFKVIAGREVGNTVPSMDTIVLTCPKLTKTVNIHEMAANVGLGLLEAEMLHNGLVSLNMTGLPPADRDLMIYRKTLDSLIGLCKIAHEFETVKNNSKFLDLVDKLGHDGFYREYVSGAPYDRLGHLLIQSVHGER